MSDGSITIEVELTKGQIEQGLKSLKTDLNSLEKTTSNISSKISKGLNSIGNASTKAGKTLTLGLTTPLIALGTAGVKYNAQMEDFEANLTTLLGNADKAKEMLSDLKEMANTTPFETSDLLESTQMMLGFGLAADKTQGYLQTLGDISMGNSEKLMSLTRAFSQIGASGKATMEDINQMIDAGFNPLQIISEKTGKSMADLREEVSDGKITFEDIADAMKIATSEGGRYYKAMEKASKTMNGKLSSATDALKTALGDLTQSLLPIVTKVIEKITDWANAFAELDDETKETILKIAGVAIAIGPVLTAVGKLITVINTLSKAFTTIANPIGLAVTAITTSIGLISLAVQNMEKDTKEAFSNMGNSATEFVQGVDVAKSHLSEFNSTLFASSEEQQELQNQMQEIQNGITQICKTASDERRDYTQEEITQLEEYFKKLRELKDREIEIQQSISKAISQQAEQNAKTFQGNLEEYKINSQEWINTAQQQAETEIDLINERTTQEIALLQQRYGEKATLENEEYAREYNNAMMHKEQLIAQANEQVASVNSAYAQGYFEKSKQESDWYNTLKTYSDKQVALQQDHDEKIRKIKDGELWYVTNKAQAIQSENEVFAFHQQDTWNEMYKNMSDHQEKELGVWLAMVAQTELYGGEIDSETQSLVDTILESYDSMPDGTKEAMKNAMQPMLDEMEKKEPSLFAKASNIADGILNRLKKSFDIHSPSKKTREIFQNVMKGSELGLKDEEKNIYNQIRKISKGILNKFDVENLYNKMKSAIDFETGKISANLSTNATVGKVLTANITVKGDTYMDSTKVGRMTAPTVSKVLKTGGAF